MSTLTGHEIALKGLNVWMPYIWTLGIMVFSTGLFIGGVAGEPRRTNMGLSYTNPTSPLYQPTWKVAKLVGTHRRHRSCSSAMLLYFIVFFATLLRKRTSGAGAGAAASASRCTMKTSPAVQSLHAVARRRGDSPDHRLHRAVHRARPRQVQRRAAVQPGEPGGAIAMIAS